MRSTQRFLFIKKSVCFLMLFSIAMCCIASLSEPEIKQIIEESHRLSDEKNYDAALKLLFQAERKAPENFELKMAIARTIDWQGDHEGAAQRLLELEKNHPPNPDIKLAQAYNQFYQSNYDQSQEIFEQILEDYPNYTDAQVGLDRVRSIAKSAESLNWLFDIGYEYSSFSRLKLTPWRQTFMQLTRLFNQKNTAVYGRVDRDDEFNSIDVTYTLGLEHRFSKRLYAYFFNGSTPGNATFQPKWTLAGGGGVRIDPEILEMPLWVTLNTRRDDYTNALVQNISPGLRFEPFGNWAINWREIIVTQPGVRALYGWYSSVEGAFIDEWRFKVGYSNAPETVAGQTVETRTWFGGFDIDLFPTMTLHLNYTHDNRQDSYIRRAYYAGVTYRF